MSAPSRTALSPSRFLMLAALLGVGAPPLVQAQVVTDGTLGAAAALSGPAYAIGADLGRQVGGNLFHSFSHFNLARGESATFAGPAAVTNVISRVTGGGISNIDGRIASTIAGANFFFLNPAGIVFGPNASLDVGGTAHFSTGNHLNFADGAVFSASNPAASTLTVADPADFGFLGRGAAIELQGATLASAPGKSLNFSAGEIHVQDSRLLARGGSLDLTAQDSGGVSLRNSQLSADSYGDQAPGTIYLIGGQILLEGSAVSSDNTTAAQAGTVFLNAAGVASLSDSRIETSASGAGAGAGIMCWADSLWLDGSRLRAQSDGAGSSGNVTLSVYGDVIAYGERATGYSYIGSHAYGSGNAGYLLVDAGRLELWDGAQISSSSFASALGSGGSIIVDVDGTVIASGVNSEGYPSGIISESLGYGMAGGVTVLAGDLVLRDGGLISTSTFSGWPGSGSAGSILINAASSVQVRGVNANGRVSGIWSNTSGSGEAGYVTIFSPLVGLLDGGQIGSNSFGIWPDAGSGGLINISASQFLLADGIGTNDRPSGIFAETSGPGNAGSINVTAGDIYLSGGAQINTTSYGLDVAAGSGGMITLNASGKVAIDGMSANATAWRSGVLANTQGRGDAGFVWINAGSVEVSGGGLITSSSTGTLPGAGAGDMVTIEADTVRLSGVGDHGDRPASGIYTESAGSGTGGYIEIVTNRLEVLDGGKISSTSFSTAGDGGDGGYIGIVATEGVKLSGAGANGYSGGIFAETYGGGEGGFINITAGALEVSAGAQILAVTRSGDAWAGAGGYVSLEVSGRATLRGVGSNEQLSGIYAVTTGAGDAKFITLTAGELAVLDGAQISATAFGTRGDAGNGGSMLIDVAGDTLIAGFGVSGHRSYPSGLLAETSGPGDGGFIALTTGSLHLLDGGAIGSGSFGAMPGAGAGGDIMIESAGDLVIAGASAGDVHISNISSESHGPGRAGNIWMSGRNIMFSEGGFVSSIAYADTDSPGEWGFIGVNASETLRLAGTSAGGSPSGIYTNTEGNAYAGDIYIESRRLEVVDGASISSSSFGEYYDARGDGVIKISSDSILVAGTDRDGAPSGIYTETYGPGDAGWINITARSLELGDGGRISSTTHSTRSNAGYGGWVDLYVSEDLSIAGHTPNGDASGVFVQTLGTGLAGDIWIEAGRLSMRDGAEISSATRGWGSLAGDGGSVFISAGNIDMSGKAADGTPTSINAASLGPGTAGEIEMHAAGALRMAGGAQIATRADFADGGEIILRAGELIKLSHSSITTSVGTGFGNGGNIDIDPRFVVLNDSLIQANAYGGDGGNIRIVTDYLVASTTSRIEASSELGIDGNVEVTSPNVDVGSGLIVMPSHFLDNALLLRDACAGRAEQATASSFVGVGNGGLPQGSLGPLPTRYDELLPDGRQP